MSTVTAATPNSAATAAPKPSPARTARAASVGEFEAAPVEPIDYEPALAAIGDLFSWAFDLAEKNVAHWREGKRRVKRARRYVRALMRGRVPRGAEAEADLAFTAGLLVRIFDADLGLGLGAIVSIFDELRLPTDDVPRQTVPREAAPATSQAALRHIRAIYRALSPVEAESAGLVFDSLTYGERLQWLERLTRLSVPAAVAVVRTHLYTPSGITPLRGPTVLRVASAPRCAGCTAAPSPFRVAA